MRDSDVVALILAAEAEIGLEKHDAIDNLVNLTDHWSDHDALMAFVLLAAGQDAVGVCQFLTQRYPLRLVLHLRLFTIQVPNFVRWQKSGRTLAHLAVTTPQKTAQVLTWLHSIGVNINSRDLQMNTPFLLAAYYCNIAVSALQIS